MQRFQKQQKEQAQQHHVDPERRTCMMRLHPCCISPQQCLPGCATTPHASALQQQLREPFTCGELATMLALLRSGHPIVATGVCDAIFACIDNDTVEGQAVLSAGRRQQVLDAPDLLAVLVGLALDTSSCSGEPQEADQRRPEFTAPQAARLVIGVLTSASLAAVQRLLRTPGARACPLPLHAQRLRCELSQGTSKL